MNKLQAAVSAAIFALVSVSASAAGDTTPSTERAKQKVVNAGDKVEDSAKRTTAKAKSKAKKTKKKAAAKMDSAADKMSK